MSGGSFDYTFHHVDDFADGLENRLEKKDDEYAVFDSTITYTPKTIAKLKEIIKLSRKTAKLMKEVEWLFSGDTGDDTFMERVKKIEKEK